MEYRVGHGWDRHRLEPGRALVLGGVAIPSESGAVAHSDGDALLHAITDAVLGAGGEEDIGRLFPDSDPGNAGRASGEFLSEAIRRAAEKGWVIANLDATVVLERPKLAPHREAIRAGIATLFGVSAERINVKGKTGEGVDAAGEGRAVEAHAVVLMSRG